MRKSKKRVAADFFARDSFAFCSTDFMFFHNKQKVAHLHNKKPKRRYAALKVRQIEPILQLLLRLPPVFID